jgi:hypothetical protein
MLYASHQQNIRKENSLRRVISFSAPNRGKK